MNVWTKERILVLVKTYPTPSASYQELVCVAGITVSGEWRRLYPVPFRSLPEYQRFKKYTWIEVLVREPNRDVRPESRSPNVDSIKLEGWVDTSHEWRERRKLVEALPVRTVADLQKQYEENKTSLGVVVPSKVHDIEYEPVTAQKLDEFKTKVNRTSMNLFGDAPKATLEPTPFDFRYVYECEDDRKTRRALIIDWELGELYRKIAAKSEPREAAEQVKNRYMEFMDEAAYDTRWFMGTTNPYNTWIVIGLFYPPKLKQAALV